MERILSRKPKTLRELNEAWFGYHNPHPMHYDNHRYHSLNLNPVWESKQTVEIRAYGHKSIMGT